MAGDMVLFIVRASAWEARVFVPREKRRGTNSLPGGTKNLASASVGKGASEGADVILKIKKIETNRVGGFLVGNILLNIVRNKRRRSQDIRPAKKTNRNKCPSV